MKFSLSALQLSILPETSSIRQDATMTPFFRLIAGAVFLLNIGVETSSAQSLSEEQLRAIASCREIPKSKHRLRCFERTTEVLQQFAPFAAAEAGADAEGSETSSSAVAGVASADPYIDDEEFDPAASFGAEDLIPDEENEIKELRAVAVAVSQNKRGKYIIRLANGQVWRQLQSDTNKIRFRPDKAEGGHDVIIKKRSLGSYSLRTTSAKRSILVRRVK